MTRTRATALVAVLALALAAPLQAGIFTWSSPAPCAEAATQPFLPFGDELWYALVPQGDLEQATEWTLSGGARLIAENEPLGLGGVTGASSLFLPGGSSATTAPMCVTEAHPVLRFAVANAGSHKKGLEVELVSIDAEGEVESEGIAKIKAGPSWAPSPVIDFSKILGDLLEDRETATVAFRFAAEDDDGAWKIDAVYIDPFKSF